LERFVFKNKSLEGVDPKKAKKENRPHKEPHKEKKLSLLNLRLIIKTNLMLIIERGGLVLPQHPKPTEVKI